MMCPFTYDDALAFIHGAYGKGRKKGLSNMRQLLAMLGHPETRLRAVHVAGTNGKGSVCAFVQAGLRLAGYRTGLYTSPYLVRYNERMRIDGTPIADGALASLAQRVAEATEALRAQDVWPTEFEIGTAIAFLYFAESGVDLAVIEVGLGGRLDPTNVLSPLVTAIAAIGHDHTGILGDTLEAIAAEKAGIAKPGVPMLVSAQNGASVTNVIEAACRAADAPCSIAPPWAGALPGLAGPHQRYNAGVAAGMLRCLSQAGYPITEAAIEAGIRQARWPGRLEWAQGRPPLLLDGAHNEQGAQALAAYIRSLPVAPTALVCGVLGDKDWQRIVASLSPIADRVFAVRPDNPRALDAAQLAEAFANHGVPAQAMRSLPDALAAACEAAGAEGRIVLCGSLYLVGEAKAIHPNAEDALLAPESEGPDV